MSKIIYDYMFDCCTTIETSKDFDEITVPEFCAAMRAHLDRIEEANDLDAFGEVDCFEVEE